jgi:hypothetical protein
MPYVSTKTPIFDDTPSIEFFNGRLLSGEDMTTEQAWNAARRKLLGQAVGSGVVFGLEVSKYSGSEHSGKPVVTVKPGLAINADGETLGLPDEFDVVLVQDAAGETLPVGFTNCTPTQYGAYLKAAGVYLLAVCPANGKQGRAPVSGLGNQEARCNAKYRFEGLQFRLHQIKLTASELANTARLRNLVAYRCFNPEAAKAFVTDPFRADPSPALLDGLLVPRLEDSEVPLATIYWTVGGGIEYVDNWSVRRRLSRPLTDVSWPAFGSERRRIAGEAMVWQFSEELAQLIDDKTKNPTTVVATQRFRYLPPVGVVPLLSNQYPRGLHPDLFFDGLTHHPVQYVEGARVEALIRAAPNYPPVDLNNPVSLWIYRVRENDQAVATLPAVTRPYLIFSSGHMPYMGDPHYDVNRWDFGNWA